MICVGCSSFSDQSIVLPPTRIGTGTFQGALGERYTFESALSEADVVARIEVGNWISEDTDIFQTYYEATVLECFKGSIPTSFTLLQDGCSQATEKRYPLFTHGNELLVFLNEATLTDYESPYWIIGSFTTVFDVFYDNGGDRYYADRYGIMGELTNISRNYALVENVSNVLRNKAIEEDPIIEEMQYEYPYIFSETDIMNLLAY